MSVYTVVYEMLHDRGFDDIESTEDSMIIAKNHNDQRILVYFVSAAKVSVKKIKEIKDLIEEDSRDFYCLILVYKGSITSFAKQFITTDVNNVLVQVFSEKELAFNITKHSLVPAHKLLSEVEKQEVIKRYKTKSKNFPDLLCTDPVSKYHGFVPGNMIQITRKSPTAGTYVSYRVVV